MVENTELLINFEKYISLRDLNHVPLSHHQKKKIENAEA